MRPGPGGSWEDALHDAVLRLSSDVHSLRRPFDVPLRLGSRVQAYGPGTKFRLDGHIVHGAPLHPHGLRPRPRGEAGTLVAAQTPVQKTGTFNVLVGRVNDILQYAVGDPLRYLANWGRLYSLWPVHLETACCSVEVGAAAGARFDFERFGALE